MLLFFTLSILLFTLAYSFLIWRLMLAWDVHGNTFPSITEPVPVSIIIPARNESGNILKTLKGVFAQVYPFNLFEVIVIDDHSTDNTYELVSTHFPQVILIKNLAEEIGKKPSLLNGISSAKNPIIISLDADCYPSNNNWLTTLVSNLVGSKKLALTGPVLLESDGSTWQNFQGLENLGMMLTTAAGYTTRWFQLSNGANLIFYKEIFEEVNGFEGNEAYASGDDMFLFEKIEIMSPGKTGFVKSTDASVITLPCKSVNEYIDQRTRWGTKNKALKNIPLKLILGFTFLYNLLLIGSILIVPFIIFPLVIGILISWLTKTNIDYFMLSKVGDFFNQDNLKKSYWSSIFIYPFMLTITGFLSLFKRSYTWKERKME